MKQGIIRGIELMVGILFCFLIGANGWIYFEAKPFHTSDLSLVSKKSVGLLLGTAKFHSSGEENIFYRQRISSIVTLFKAKKIDCILISGDNTSLEYNEPLAMQNSLLEEGIPPERMYLDYAGVRTLDSLIRAKEIFGVDHFIVVSQAFHTARAIFLARSLGLDVYGYDAMGVDFFASIPIYLREFFSRGIAIFDVLFETPPKFSGERVNIEYNPSVRPVPHKICSPRDY